MYSRRNESFGMIHHFWSCEIEQCKIITPLGFATGPCLKHAERQPTKSNQDEINYRQQQMLNGQYLQSSVNDFWPCIMEIAWAVRRRYAIIVLSAAFLGKTSCNNIATMS